jgi:hypothetical protein
MFEQSILFPSLPSVSLAEILIVFFIACGAYFIVFNNFEKHAPIQRRITKLFIVVGVLSVIGIFFQQVCILGRDRTHDNGTSLFTCRLFSKAWN